MSAKTATKKAASFPDDEARTRQYIRETCRELDDAYDREALRLLFGVGVLSVDDPSEITKAVERLRKGDRRDLQAEVYDKLPKLSDEMRAHFSTFEDLHFSELTDSVDVAYLLGIAVGRRLGPGALRITGGVR